MEDVRQYRSQPVPKHLLPATHPRMRQHGIGVGYKLPHDYEGADVEQQYLPGTLVGRRYHEPTDQGYEARIKERLDALLAERRAARVRQSNRRAPR
jgi:putative ATPase